MRFRFAHLVTYDKHTERVISKIGDDATVCALDYGAR
jgi:hypothetical protein